MWKTSIAAVLLRHFVACECTTERVTDRTAKRNTRPAPQVVQWQLQVLRDGQQIDAFDGTTTVGQARTDTHHKMVQHNVGCKDQPAGSIDLARTLTVSPLQADATASRCRSTRRKPSRKTPRGRPTPAASCRRNRVR